ncbi:MAG: TolC family protein [Armatimonadota bacterium]|nr:TolC family protein [Armatimonadota bacterium]MDR7533217.1 TolC family protein [Armatimonadota bacterium]MDR7535395.1 TolC family protein [Armatimonadota bacterium]
MMPRRAARGIGPAGVAVLLAAVLIPSPGVRAQVARPITLAEVLTLAAQHSPALRAAAFEVTVARTQLAQAEALRSGTLVLTGSYTRINDREGGAIVIPGGTVPGVSTPITIPLPPPTPDLYTTALTFQYPLHTGGRIEAQVALARANLQGAEAALERAKQQLILDARQAYYQVLLAQAGVEGAQRTLAAAEENLRVARARVAAGTSPRFDEVQAEVNVASARQGLIRARNALALAQHALAALVGQPMDAPLQPGERMTFAAVRTDLAVLLRRALDARPELAEHRARIAAATAAIEVARAGARPALVLSGGPTWGNATSAGLGSSAAVLGWSLTLAATVPLFDGGLTAQRIREAEARVAQLQAAEVQLRQGIELDVRRALLTLAAAMEELAAADVGVQQGQEGLRIANVRFAAGVSTNLEVITAQAALSQAEASRIQALFNVNMARAQLERAVGGPVE